MTNKFKVVAAVAMVLGGVCSLFGASQPCSLPDQVIGYRVVGNDRSFTPAQFSDVPSGYSISNVVYEGWCVQYDTFIAAGPVYRGGLYDSYGPLPVHLRNLPWDKINYILNHKRGSAWDVQFVIWHTLGQAPNPPSSTPMVEMIADVAQNGAGFVPSHGQVVGVLVESQEGVQRLIIETMWDERCRDTVPPSVTMASPAAQTVYTQATVVPFSANAQDNIGVTRVEFYHGTELVHVRDEQPYTCPWPITEADNGNHDWSVKAYDFAGNSVATSPMTVTVRIDVVAPTVSITSPASETLFSTAQTVPLTVAATDNFGVTRVELYDRGVLKATLTGVSLVHPWGITAADNGTHNWTARAYDAAGNSTESAVVSLDVAIDAEPPSVFITSPASGTRFDSARTVVLTAQAFDNFGVSRVEFFNGGTLMGTLTQAPFTFSWQVSSALNGSHQWTARAHDAAGLSTLSAVINLEVAIDDVAPAVALVSPTSGSVFSVAQTIPLRAEASDNFGVTRVEFYQGGVLRGSQVAPPYRLDWTVTSSDNGTHLWTVRAYDAVGHVTASGAHTLTVDIDIELPSVTIVAPAAGAALTNQVVGVHGTASDNVEVLRVEYQVDDGPFAVAQGTTSWQVQLPLSPGAHQVRVRSIDTAGHVSLSAVRNFHYYETDALRVMMTGQGTVTPTLDGQPLELNKTYQLTATPAIGYAFSNWSGGVGGSARQLQFVMRPSLMVQANFVPDPFQPEAATYNGLFYQSAGVEHATSGSFYLRTTTRGTFSGYLMVEGRRVSLRGRVDDESKATVAIPRRGAAPLIVQLHLYTLEGRDYVRGQVTDGTWTADLLGDRVRFYGRGETSPFMGRYTAIVPATTEMTVSGHGYGTVIVDRLGGVRLSATLGDGTRLSQRAYVSADGQWPLYGPLYRTQGSVLGWLIFTNSGPDDLVGDINWTKPSNARDRLYPAGFTNVTSLIGSSFVYTRGQPTLNLPEAILSFREGGLDETIVNLVSLDYRNRVVNLSENGLRMSISAGSGLISGRVLPPDTRRWLAFRGVVHQKRNMAFGHFLGTGVTGSVQLDPRE